MRKEKLQKWQGVSAELRSPHKLKHTRLHPNFRFVAIAYHVITAFLIIGIIYDVAKIAIVKRGTKIVKSEEVRSISQIRALQELCEKTQRQVEKTNRLVEWQFDDLHGQKLLYALFHKLPKELLLENFSFKRDQTNHQINLSIVLKGGHRELHNEFEATISKLEALGFILISQNQSQINGGMRFNLTCQTNSPKSEFAFDSNLALNLTNNKG